MFSRVTAALLFLFVFATAVIAQTTATGSLRGKVTDPSGAVVQNATVTATSSGGKQSVAKSNAQGVYELTGLAPGSYTVTVSAKGFTLDTEPSVNVAAGAPQQFDIALQIEVEKENIQVDAQANQVDTSSDNNASALVIKGKDLEALSDDPDELQNELDALAGPAAGPNGGQIYIDGFTGGQLPPKASIREIRVNQNPFSAEYDKLGYGRVEIFTKPGMDKFHGQFFVIGNDDTFNATNPFATQGGASIPPYHSEQFSGNLSGPIISKKASFFVNAERRDINNESVIYTPLLDPTTYNFSTYSQAISTPQTRTNVSPRLDFQLTPTNTLTARYQYWQNSITNQGVSGFALPSLAYDSKSTENTFQLSDTQILGPYVINETRFEYERDMSQQTPFSTAPEINVQGAASFGGNVAGYVTDHQDHYEVQNYTSWVHGKHMFKFGGRLRDTRDANDSNSNYNGQYTFSSLEQYAITLYGLNNGYSWAQIQGTCTPPPGSNVPTRAGQCGGVTQYTQIVGAPTIVANYVDAGLYFQDEYKWKPNFTVSYGLRFETQNAIQDHGDWAPRLGIAWGLGKKGTTPKTVLRAGYGIFYDRFQIANILNADRLNGVVQQEYIFKNPTLTSPDFNAPACSASGCNIIGNPTVASTTYQISQNLRAPYTMQAAASLERQLWKNATGALTYVNSRGDHALVIINDNAPYMPSYNPAVGNVYQYYTEGVFKQNQLIANINWRAGARFSVFGNYSLSYANSDVNGSTSAYATNSADLMQDYGPAQFSVRNRVMIGGSFTLPYMFRFSPFVIYNSGIPYNFLAGEDLNGDSFINDRAYFCPNPGVAGNGCVGNYTSNPVGAKLVPEGYGTGPGGFTFNMRFGKTFGIGPKLEKNASAGGDSGPGGGGRGGPPGMSPFGTRGGGGRGGMFGDTSDRKYTLTFNVLVRNLFNDVNYGAPVGIVTSPLFGQSVALAGGPFGSGAYNRRLDLQAVFSF